MYVIERRICLKAQFSKKKNYSNATREKIITLGATCFPKPALFAFILFATVSTLSNANSVSGFFPLFSSTVFFDSIGLVVLFLAPLKLVDAFRLLISLGAVQGQAKCQKSAKSQNKEFGKLSDNMYLCLLQFDKFSIQADAINGNDVNVLKFALKIR